MTLSVSLRGASPRRLGGVAALLTAALLGGVVTRADAQVGSGSATTPKVRSDARDSARVRRAQLLIRFDSLRQEFEHARLSDAEREGLENEMHRTMMAMQESMNDMDMARAYVAAPDAREDVRMRGPGFAIAVGGPFATRGYLGLSFDGPNVESLRKNERVIRFLDYPRIALVEPSSPAEHAGILEGDTLLALNGSDVRDHDFSLTRILVPDQRIRVRVRREGTPMDFRVVVAEAPGYVVSRMTPLAPMAPVVVRINPGEEMTPMPSMPRMPAPAVAAGPAPMPMPWVMQDGVAGARLESITEGLGRALGTSHGVLVIRAAPGSPAFESGLRDGDVIVRADRGTVRSVRELRQALQDADGDAGVKLVVLRERKQRELTLRW